VLKWCTDSDGFLTNRARLERVCEARRYHPGWVQRVHGRHWRDVMNATKKWSKRSRLEEEEKNGTITRTEQRSMIDAMTDDDFHSVGMDIVER
jgi:hypothetical protein